jgi:uncharacterized protein (DUF1800 family)
VSEQGNRHNLFKLHAALSIGEHNMTKPNLKRTSLEAGRAVIVSSLCGLLLMPQSAFAAGDTPAPKSPLRAPAARKAPLTQDEKVLHTLNRLTFGPRPGDEAEVKKMGLDAWLNRQLHPETITDAALDTKLDEFPALKLSIGQMYERYPSPNLLKRMTDTSASLPTDPIEHAIYADSMEFYNTRVKALSPEVKKEDATATPSEDMTASVPNGEKTNAKGKLKPSGPPMDREKMRQLLSLAPEDRFNALLAMSPQEMVSFRRGMRPFSEGILLNGMTPVQKEDVVALEGGERLIGGEALEERLLRDVYSQRQVQAVMDDFWINHFSVYVRKNQNEPYLLASYERDAILPNSLGKFEDLLVATAKSPAMLMYLDNWLSIGPDSAAAERGKRFEKMAPNSKVAKLMPKGINENYARELMELHTLGVNGGYTQKDVIEVAKCFTGWTIDRPYGGLAGDRRGRYESANAQPGEFYFDPSRHEPGTKTVLGHTIQEDGVNEGLQVLHILATSPATAKFVSTKLAVRFVSDNPPPALVSRMTATFLKTDGDLKAVISTMYHSPEFFSPAVYRAKVKTPIEFMASALRASDADIQNPVVLVQAMTSLGMPIYGMQTPNGYSWKADEWVSSNALVSRMNFALVLAGGRVPGAKLNWPDVLGEASDTNITNAPTPKTESRLEHAILGEPAGLHTRQTVLANYNDPAMQKNAAEGFSKATQMAATKQDANGDDSMTSSRMKSMSLYGKKSGGNGPSFLNDKPEAPLDTMAGLLIGSPDFQRR